jgi:hypothetical protein
MNLVSTLGIRLAKSSFSLRAAADATRGRREDECWIRTRFTTSRDDSARRVGKGELRPVSSEERPRIGEIRAHPI